MGDKGRGTRNKGIGVSDEGLRIGVEEQGTRNKGLSEHYVNNDQFAYLQ